NPNWLLLAVELLSGDKLKIQTLPAAPPLPARRLRLWRQVFGRQGLIGQKNSLSTSYFKVEPWRIHLTQKSVMGFPIFWMLILGSYLNWKMKGNGYVPEYSPIHWMGIG